MWRCWIIGGLCLAGVVLLTSSNAWAADAEAEFVTGAATASGGASPREAGISANPSFTIALPAPEAAAAGSKSDAGAASDDAWPPRVGFAREVPADYRGDLASRLRWMTGPDGSQIATLQLRSPEAHGLRVALKANLGMANCTSTVLPTRRAMRI